MELKEGQVLKRVRKNNVPFTIGKKYLVLLDENDRPHIISDTGKRWYDIFWVYFEVVEDNKRRNNMYKKCDTVKFIRDDLAGGQKYSKGTRWIVDEDQKEDRKFIVIRDVRQIDGKVEIYDEHVELVHKASTEFKKGDKVRCIDAGQNSYITEGKEYPIIHIDDKNEGLFITIADDRNKAQEYLTARFELSKKAEEEKENLGKPILSYSFEKLERITQLKKFIRDNENKIKTYQKQIKRYEKQLEELL